MTLRKTILLLGVFGIFFAFACPLAPTPTLVCKTFLVLVFAFVLAWMSRTAAVVTTFVAELPLARRALAGAPPHVSSRILLC